MKAKLLVATLGVLAVTYAFAAPHNTIIDTTLGTSTRDGALNAGEYGNLTYFSSGTGSGFGNVLGSNSKIYWDSSYAGGALNLGIQLGGGGLFDRGVIYIDSVAGGFADTTTINDNGDPGRAAISGNGTGGGTSELTFAAGFNPDYAITIEDGFAGLFQLNAGGAGSLGFVTTLNFTPTGNPSLQQREGELLLSDIGLLAGDSFKWVATYLNSGNAFRSDELNGQDTLPGGNIGNNPFTFDNYNLVQSVPEPATTTLLGVGLLAGVSWMRRKRA